MSDQSRKATRKLLEMVEDGVLDRHTVMLACLNYMSEDDVADLCHREGFFEHEEEDDESIGEAQDQLADESGYFNRGGER